MFKEGDLVRVREITGCNKELFLHDLHVVESVSSYLSSNGNPYIRLYSWNRRRSGNNYYSYRFKKVIKEDLTEEEKFNYMKYKLGIKENYNGKKEKRTERT